jgi:hypothetical protein
LLRPDLVERNSATGFGIIMHAYQRHVHSSGTRDFCEHISAYHIMLSVALQCHFIIKYEIASHGAATFV